MCSTPTILPLWFEIHLGPHIVALSYLIHMKIFLTGDLSSIRVVQIFLQWFLNFKKNCPLTAISSIRFPLISWDPFQSDDRSSAFHGDIWLFPYCSFQEELWRPFIYIYQHGAKEFFAKSVLFSKNVGYDVCFASHSKDSVFHSVWRSQELDLHFTVAFTQSVNIKQLQAGDIFIRSIGYRSISARIIHDADEDLTVSQHYQMREAYQKLYDLNETIKDTYLQRGVLNLEKCALETFPPKYKEVERFDESLIIFTPMRKHEWNPINSGSMI